jgi:hypothetical protein
MRVPSSAVTKVLTVWLAGLVLAIVAAAATIMVLNATLYGPEHQVRNYVDALEAGNGERALGLLDARIPEANAAMLDGPALQQSMEHLDSVETGDPEPAGGSRVEVPLDYSVRGSSHTTTFLLEKTGSEWLFFDRWEFVPAPLPTLELSVVNQEEASLNGVRVAAPGGTNSFAVFYPGEFEAHYASEYFAAPAQTRVVDSRNNSAARITLATAATAKLVEAVDTQIRRFLDECAEQDVLQPAGCPFNFQTDGRIAGELQWSVTEYPEIAIEPYNGRWVVQPLTGTAQLKTSVQDLFTGAVEPLTYEQDFDFDARLSVSASEITVTPMVDY